MAKTPDLRELQRAQLDRLALDDVVRPTAPRRPVPRPSEAEMLEPPQESARAHRKAM
jgi:hypothetical protein